MAFKKGMSYKKIIINLNRVLHYFTNKDLKQCFRLLFNQVTGKNRDRISIRRKYGTLVGERRQGAVEREERRVAALANL